MKAPKAKDRRGGETRGGALCGFCCKNGRCCIGAGSSDVSKNTPFAYTHLDGRVPRRRQEAVVQKLEIRNGIMMRYKEKSKKADMSRIREVRSSTGPLFAQRAFGIHVELRDSIFVDRYRAITRDVKIKGWLV